MLEFNLAKSSTGVHRVAVFSSQDEKEEYIVAESRACASFYRTLGKALTKTDREEAKATLDQARWKFFNTWINVKSLKKVIA